MNPENRELAKNLLRVKVDAMNEAELSLGMALLMQQAVRVDNGLVYVQQKSKKEEKKEETWIEYNPFKNAAQLLDVLKNHELVVGTHETEDEKTQKKSFWYSAHGFMGGIKADEHTFETAVAKTAVLLLEWNLQYKYPEESKTVRKNKI